MFRAKPSVVRRDSTLGVDAPCTWVNPNMPRSSGACQKKIDGESDGF